MYGCTIFGTCTFIFEKIEIEGLEEELILKSQMMKLENQDMSKEIIETDPIFLFFISKV